MRILYFEGVGMRSLGPSKKTAISSRIRTAFHLDDGKAVYLEIVGSKRTKSSNPDVHRWQYTGFVEAVHYITDEIPNKDCNEHKIILPGELLCGGWINARTFNYTYDSILKYVNNLGASFDAIKVLSGLEGYRVFSEELPCQGLTSYHYGDEFQYNHSLIFRREKVYQYYYMLEKSEGKEYPNFSLWIVEDDPGALHLIRRFSGSFQTAHNTHWIIRVDKGDNIEDWIASAKKTCLGKYGC